MSRRYWYVLGGNTETATAYTRHANPGNIPSFSVDEATGFLEALNNKGLEPFDATKKLAFIEALRANDFRLIVTCQQLGISTHTIYKHRRNDKSFDDAIRESINEYAEHLEWTSRAQALEPKATLERIFQLRALLPDRYARDLKGQGGEKIEINITGDMFVTGKRHNDALETTIVREIESANDPVVDVTVHQAPISLDSPTVGA